ncbi:hypothetical protein MY10362_001514 [Beauveria mimosiformis]
MDSSSLGLAWGRLSHRRTRSSDPSSNNTPPIEFTSDGTKYTLASETPTHESCTAQHGRSKSWTTSKEKSQTTTRLSMFFHSTDYSNYRAFLSPPNPLDLHRTTSSSRGSHRTSKSTLSISTKNTTLSGSSSSIELPKRLSAPPPQRPPRPARGLFEDDSDGELSPVAEDQPVDCHHHDAADDNIQGLIRQSDRAFADVGIALADVTYNTYAAQAKPSMLVLSRSSLVRRRRQQGLPPLPVSAAPRSSMQSNRSTARRGSFQSTHSTSTKGRSVRHPAATKKMGKRSVLLPRKLRLTLSQSVSDLLPSRASKRVSATSSLSSVYSDYLDDDQTAHKRNSSITAAKRQSALPAKRHSGESKFSLCATHGRNLTASQMYHREMLPNSVVAWMGTDSCISTEPGDDDDDDDDDDDGGEDGDETDDEELSHDLEKNGNLATEAEPTQLNAGGGGGAAAAAAAVDSAENAAEARPTLSAEGPPPPPPPKNPARFGARARTSQLAPIPEMLVASAQGERRRRRSSLMMNKTTTTSSKSKRAGAKTEAAATTTTRDSLYLIGTAYSRASPLFRHGHIEFQHKSLRAKKNDDHDHDDGEEPDSADQHEVDWPKYHCSALCGTDDLVSGMAQDEANAMADELGDWFDEFGFESHGTLVRSGRPRKASPSSSSSSSSESSRSSASSASTMSDADLPMPASPDRSPSSSSFARMHSWSFGQAERNASASAAARDEHASDPIPVMMEMGMELGLDTYGLPSSMEREEEEHLKKKQMKQDLSFAASGGPRMSCNLSQDLGQFLARNPTLFDDINEEDE